MNIRIGYKHTDSFVTYPRVDNLSAKTKPIRERPDNKAIRASPHARDTPSNATPIRAALIPGRQMRSVEPVSSTSPTARRCSGVKRRRAPVTGAPLSAGTRTRLMKCQQHKPTPCVTAAIRGSMRHVEAFRLDGVGAVAGESALLIHHDRPNLAHRPCIPRT